MITGGVAYTGFKSIASGSGNDTLTAANATNTWTVSGANSGQVVSSQYNYQFSGIENLVGGTGADQYTVEATASLSGVLRDNGGADKLVLAARSTPVSVSTNAASRSVTGVVNAFSGMEQIEAQGSLTNQLVGGPANTTWTMMLRTDCQRGITYAGFKSIASGSGNDALGAANATNTWTLIGANAGQVVSGLYNYQFTGIENLFGGTGADQFTIQAGASFRVLSLPTQDWTLCCLNRVPHLCRYPPALPAEASQEWSMPFQELSRLKSKKLNQSIGWRISQHKLGHRCCRTDCHRWYHVRRIQEHSQWQW